MAEYRVDRGPSVFLVPTDNGGNATSRGDRTWLGGRPRVDLTNGWPRDSAERPMWFVAQIDLSDVPFDVWRGRGPRSGWLAVFVSNESQCCVLHVSSLGSEQVPPPKTPDLTSFKTRSPSEAAEIPSEWQHTDATLVRTFKGSKAPNKIGGKPDSDGEGCWPLFWDENMKKQREGRLEPWMPRTDPPFDNVNHLLLQLGSGQSPGWRWGGDWGVSLIIAESDLVDGRFDRVEMRAG